MNKTTLCYIFRDDEVLMLFRNKKKDDPNEGKWLGIGGGIEAGETPDEGMLREVREETGIGLNNYRFLGVIGFESDVWGNEEMYLYRAKVDSFTEFLPCDEGELAWVKKDDIFKLPLWEGDKVFLKPLLRGDIEINLTLHYKGDKLEKVTQIN